MNVGSLFVVDEFQLYFVVLACDPTRDMIDVLVVISPVEEQNGNVHTISVHGYTYAHAVEIARDRRSDQPI